MKTKPDSVAVIGAGPCGVAAAVQLRRTGIEFVLYERSRIGGLLHNAHKVENYPGFPQGISGAELCRRLEQHLDAWKIETRFAEVRHLERTPSGYLLRDSRQTEVACSAVIVATGTRPSRGVLAAEDGPLRKRIFHEVRQVLDSESGQRVAVVGGGDAAYDYALHLASKGYIITLLQRGPSRCLPLLKKRVLETPAIHLRSGVQVERCREARQGLEIVLDREAENKLEVDSILIACGRSPEDALLTPFRSSPDKEGVLPPRLYAGGDLVRGPFRQAGIAVGDGLAAAMSVVRDLCDKTPASHTARVCRPDHG